MPQDIYPEHGTFAERKAWLDNESALQLADAFNPDPFPRNCGQAAQVAWHTKNMELRRAAKLGTPATRATTVAASDAALVNDVLTLPMDVATKRNFAASQTDLDERHVSLSRLLVASKRCGGLPAEVIVEAVQELHGIEVLGLMRENSELQDEIRDLKRAQDHAERDVIDSFADKLHVFTKRLIEQKVKRGVESLETRVLAKSSQITNEGEAIGRLDARATLLEGRVRHLELTNPVWVAINTSGGGAR